MDQRKLPIGIDSFEKLRRENFYYVDKTGLIKDLLDSWGEVNLFTRPRRFGKTLNMSMLKNFFEIGCDERLFQGLAITQDSGLCQAYMGKFPVISLSLKSVDGMTFDDAYDMIRDVIREEAFRFIFLKDSVKIEQEEKLAFQRILNGLESDSDVKNSLRTMTRLLQRHFGRKVILLIDEYDVPLDKAYQHGYYDKMVNLIRIMFGQALKTNEYLFFAVLTGCLRVSKESIFTGLNNFCVNGIADTQYEEHFGFTDIEVKKLFQEYSLSAHYVTAKEWYDGYRFGRAEVYCPWDVINYARDLLADPKAEPRAYWMNTSGNDLVKRFVDKADKTTQNEIERLIAGDSIQKIVKQELTYSELDTTIDHLWSVLFTTGYLTQKGKTADGRYMLSIPNHEIKEIFIQQIQDWFQETSGKEKQQLTALCTAFKEGNPSVIETVLNSFLAKTISIQDTKARSGRKENFYHGLLLGLLRSRENWLISSNAESGIGFSDILVETEDLQTGFLIEVKYSDSISSMEKSCSKAMQQIEDKQYDMKLREDGFTCIWAYGISFYKKRCKVVGKKV